MKYLLMCGIFLASSMMAGAQTKTTGSARQQRRPATTTPKSPGLIHGPRDTTPGSPMGTGGAGGGEMAGSPAGSAIETKDQTDKAKAQPAPQGRALDSTVKPSSNQRSGLRKRKG